MEVMAEMKRTEPPTFQVIRTSNYHPVRDGWVWDVATVIEADGQLAEWEIPAYPLGGLK